MYQESNNDNLVKVGNNRGRHFVALAESLSCPRVRIWTKHTQPKTRGGEAGEGLVWKNDGMRDLIM